MTRKEEIAATMKALGYVTATNDILRAILAERRVLIEERSWEKAVVCTKIAKFVGKLSKDVAVRLKKGEI